MEKINARELKDLFMTSREAGSVGGQMVKKMWPVRSVKFERDCRVAVGHRVEVKYIVGVIV